MCNKRMKSLLQAFSAACDTSTQHILLTITAEGRVHASGTDNMVTGMVGDVALYNRIKTCMTDNKISGSVGYANTLSAGL